MRGSALVGAAAGGPKGQAFWRNQGSQSFVVPELVTAISVVLIGGGGANYNIDDGEGNTIVAYGGGGGLVYVNGLPVTPGETLTVITDSWAGSGGSARLLRGATSLLTAGGGSRGDGSVSVAAYFGSAGGSGSADASVVGAVLRTGGHGYDLGPGAGAAKYSGPPGYTPTSLNGAADTIARLCGQQGSGAGDSVAGARIIWGPGREFPAIETADVA
ncbi:hypothetical protein [Brevundimonas bacteroides]|uniref:hypothetical protein n=1 Tax=Brevundimonas bacteroides TaxID=74311 RepID=UPI0004951AC8|nr:hypothetical protein [Brevundimonas bacteroides]